MHQFCSAVLTLAVVVAGAVPAQAQTKVAPFYSLPEDGVWVEFNFKCKDRQNHTIQGTMRISSVGQLEISGISYRWVEIKMHESATLTRYGKLLVAEEALLAGQPLEGAVIEAYHKEGKNGPVARFSGKQMNTYLTMGVAGQHEVVSDSASAETGLGVFTCKYVTATGKVPQKLQAGKVQADKQRLAGDASLQYRAWLTSSVPFGLAKFEVWAYPGAGQPAVELFSAVATSTGEGAKSEVDVTELAARK
jgi:hypothetical protein